MRCEIGAESPMTLKTLPKSLGPCDANSATRQPSFEMETYWPHSGRRCKIMDLFA
jgi:hypothetical protein